MPKWGGKSNALDEFLVVVLTSRRQVYFHKVPQPNARLTTVGPRVLS